MSNNGSLLMFVYLQKKNLTLQNSLRKSYLKAGDNSSKKFFKVHFLSEKLQKGNIREDHYTFLKTFRSLISKTSIFKVRVDMKSRLLLFGGSNFNCCNFLQDHHREPKETKRSLAAWAWQVGRGWFWPGAEGSRTWLRKNQIGRKLLELGSCFSQTTILRHTSSSTCYNSVLLRSKIRTALKPCIRNWTKEVGTNFRYSFPYLSR